MVLPTLFNRSPSKKQSRDATPTLAHRTLSTPTSPVKSHSRVSGTSSSSSRRSSTFSKRSSKCDEVPSGFPKTNGTTSGPPPPPQHRYNKSPPPGSGNYAATPEAATPPAEIPTIDAEEYKAAGNKFFKIKDYPAAIKEYSKGV